MSQIVNDFNTGIIIISEEYNISATPSAIDSTPVFSNIGDEYVISFIQLNRVKSFSNFEFEVIGNLQSRYLDPTYRISRNGSAWTTYSTFNETDITYRSLNVNSATYSITKLTYEINNFPPFDPLDQMWIDLKWVRSGSKIDGDIRLLDYKITGDLLQNSSSGNSITDVGGESIIKPPYIYKVFRIDDIEIVTNSDLTNVGLYWRFSQDNTRTWSDWEPLTKENVSTKRINPVRFFQAEYKIVNNSSSSVKIQDINLIGDFQNVSMDSQKTNLYGIRECCQSYLIANSANSSNAGAYDSNGNFIANTTGVLDPVTCSSGNIFAPLTANEKSTLYNPYQQSQAANLLNKLSNDAMEVFGWNVQYFVTDPDGKGIDYSLHEFGLFNIVCEGEMKVAVEGNQFPDNQISMNVFDLTLIDAFEVHITKENFKALFGVQRRPAKEDLVFFCDINRLFIVDHAQQFRNFNNYAIYYKVALKKYNKSANVKSDNQSIKDRINQLTNNSTIDQLMGIENTQDKAAVANKQQLQPLSKDPIRVAITGVNTNSLIIKELIENSTTIVSKQHYDFSTMIGTITGAIVKYNNLDPRLKVSDNIGYTMWFKLNNYVEDEVYNLFTYYNEISNIGWKVNLINDTLQVFLNGDLYEWILDNTTGTNALVEDVWYCYVLNVDQRQRKMSQFIYKRNVDIDAEDDAKYLKSTVLQQVYKNEQVITPVDYELEDINGEIMVSDMRATNIRLFIDVIPETEHTKLLNQYIIETDSKYLVFGDNANMKIVLPNFPYNGSAFEH